MTRTHTDGVFNNCGVCGAHPATEVRDGKIRIRCSECENIGDWHEDFVGLMVSWNKANRKVCGTGAVCENPRPGI